MRYLIGLLLLLLLLIAGCARYPAPGQFGPVVPPRTIYTELTVRGEYVNPSYYYFFAIDTSGNPQAGPVPVTTGTGFGNGWGTLFNTNSNQQQPPRQPPFFVEYHNGTFEQFRVNPATVTDVSPGIAESLGVPYRAYILDASHTPALRGPIISLEIDTSLLTQPGQPLPDTLEVNWITIEKPYGDPGSVIGEPLPYDGFGPKGNQYFEVPITTTNTWISGVGATPEELAYGQTYSDGQIENSTSDADIDEISWRIEVRLQ